MASPEMNRKSTSSSSHPPSSLQDSCFLNYASNLPPLNMRNPPHVTEACVELKFSSPPQVFASPRVCSQRETGVLKSPGYWSSSDVKYCKQTVQGAMLAAAPDVAQPFVSQPAIKLAPSDRMEFESTPGCIEKFPVDPLDKFGTDDMVDASRKAAIMPQPFQIGCSSSYEPLVDYDGIYDDNNVAETLTSAEQAEEYRAGEKSFPNAESYLQNMLTKGNAMHFEKKRKTPEDVSCFEFNQMSTRQNSKMEARSSEGEGCRRCKCKKTNCLKLYCECFAAGEYCVGLCSCKDCFNKLEYEDTVSKVREQIESRDPLAFTPKIMQCSTKSPRNSGEDGNQTTPASARHRRGCNCKKSKCLKKYCECYQAGVGCSIGCRCQGCENEFGSKGGQILSRGDELANTRSVRPLPQFPLSRTYTSEAFGARHCMKASNPPLLNESEESVCSPWNSSISPTSYCRKIVATPDILRETCSPVNVVNACSPKKKRVSPLHNSLSESRRSSSPMGFTSSRKFILQNVNSFSLLSPSAEPERSDTQHTPRGKLEAA